MFFEKGWANTIAEARAGEALDTTTDENRLCQWKYFARTDLIASDKTLKCQDDVWVARKTRGALSPTSIRGRIRRLAARFGGKRVESFWSGLRDENFTLDVVKVALPEEREAKLAALHDSELTVGWYGSLREAQVHATLPSTPFECTLAEGREVAWRYYICTDLIASDKTLKCQDDVWVARKTRGALSPTSIRGRIRRLAARFGGKRVESFWSGLRDENFTLDVVKVALPEEREAKLAALRVQEQQVLEAREVKKHKIFQHRLSKIAFYTSPKAVEDLLRKKDDHFMRPRTFKYVPQRTQVEALTLQSNFFLHFLKVKNDYVQETKQDDVSGDFKEQQEHRVDSQRRARYESTEEVAL